MAGSAVPASGSDAPSIFTLDKYMGYGTAFLNQDRFDLEMKKNIQYFGPKGSPFVSWLQMVKRTGTSEINFSWQEDEYFTQRDIRARLVRKAAQGSTSQAKKWIYVLQLMTGGDWHAFEAAAKGDEWSAASPLIYMTVIDAADKTHHVASTIRMPAIQYGQAQRDIVSTDLDGAETTAMAAALNAIVLYDEGPATGAQAEDPLVGGILGEVSAIPQGYLPVAVNRDPASVSYGYATFFTGQDPPEYVDVFVHVTEPNEALKGFAQGSGLPAETRKRTRSGMNYVQIFKTPYSITNTLKAVQLRGGDELGILRVKKMVQHKTEIERAMLFQGGGVMGTDWGQVTSTNDNPLTRFKGVGVGITDAAKKGVIVTKNADFDSRFVFNYTGANMTTFENLAGAIFDDVVDSPADTKIVFCSNKWLQVLNGLGLKVHPDGSGNLVGQPVFGERSPSQRNRLGLRINEVETSVGYLHFVRFPLFRGQFEDYAMVVDFSQCEYRTLRPTTLVANAGDRTVDGQIDYYITEVGYEMRQESTHAILKLGS